LPYQYQFNLITDAGRLALERKLGFVQAMRIAEWIALPLRAVKPPPAAQGIPHGSRTFPEITPI
jgi:hypothetical protein